MIEVNHDSKMVRTRNRPIPKGSIPEHTGVFLAATLSGSSMLMLSQFQPYTIVISNSVWILYTSCYIPMKKRSIYNTLVGAVVGALPPFIGSFAQAGTLMTPDVWLLALYIFSWQYPHFYGILYNNRQDYVNSGFKMISNEDPEGKLASKHIFACLALNCVSVFGMFQGGYLYPSFAAAFAMFQTLWIKKAIDFRKQ